MQARTTSDAPPAKTRSTAAQTAESRQMKLVKKNRGHGPRTTSTLPPPARLTTAPRVEQEAHIVKMYEEMGRRFALAFISYQGRITYETARKNFGHVTPTEYWITL